MINSVELKKLVMTHCTQFNETLDTWDIGNGFCSAFIVNDDEINIAVERNRIIVMLDRVRDGEDSVIVFTSLDTFTHYLHHGNVKRMLH